MSGRPITAEDFPFHGTVVEIDSRKTIEEALNVLVERGLLSVPVWDESAKK